MLGEKKKPGKEIYKGKDGGLNVLEGVGGKLP